MIIVQLDDVGNTTSTWHRWHNQPPDGEPRHTENMGSQNTLAELMNSPSSNTRYRSIEVPTHLNLGLRQVTTPFCGLKRANSSWCPRRWQQKKDAIGGGAGNPTGNFIEFKPRLDSGTLTSTLHSWNTMRPGTNWMLRILRDPDCNMGIAIRKN